MYYSSKRVESQLMIGDDQNTKVILQCVESQYIQRLSCVRELAAERMSHVLCVINKVAVQAIVRGWSIIKRRCNQAAVLAMQSVVRLSLPRAMHFVTSSLFSVVLHLYIYISNLFVYFVGRIFPLLQHNNVYM